MRELSGELERDQRAVRRRTRASLMSDTKWRKLFGALEAADVEFEQWIIKFVDVPDEKPIRALVDTRAPWAFIDTFELGPVSLRSIEWLEFPRVAELNDGDRTIPPRRVRQDVELVRRILLQLGQLPLQETERGLRIVGHLPAQSG